MQRLFVYGTLAPYLADRWPHLDAFEGDGYERVAVTVRVDGGRDVEAYVYALRRG